MSLQPSPSRTSTSTHRSAADSLPVADDTRHPRLRQGFVLAAGGFALLVLLQVFLAGGAIFGAPSWWPMHRMFGMLLSLIPLAMLALALFARLPRRFVWLSGLLFVLTGLQPVLISVPEQLRAPVLSALHPVNALVIFALTIVLAVLARQRAARAAA